jgi:8-oxo-dGTP diphosphatase
MTLRVTCAIIEHQGKVLCAQRSARMKLPLKWEFPGGKIEKGESEVDCLSRECQEELNLVLSIIERMQPVLYEFELGKWLELIPFRCLLAGGKLELREHASAKWLPPEALATLDWAEADIDVLKNYLNSIQDC